MQDEMQPLGADSAMPASGPDREGAMAPADLYKCANYSLKLFKKLSDDDQMEAWVQAKITKAADYIASVYHYLEYEMKFSEYGKALDQSEMYSEDQKAVLKGKLMEAKEKIKALKIKQADKKDKKEQEVKEEKSSTGGEITRSKNDKGQNVTKHTHNPDRFSDEPHTEPKSQAKSQSAADKAGNKAADKADEKEGKNWEKRFGKGSVTRVKDGKKVDEALKGGQKKLDTDNDDDIDEKDLANLRAKKKVAEAVKEKCNHTDKGEKCPIHGLKECGMYEAAKWRDAKHKDTLYTQEPYGDDDDRYGDDDYYNPKPDDYPGAKNLKGGGEFDHNDPLRKGYGRHGTGSMNTHGKRKGMPSRDQISSLKGSIKSAHGTHPRPNLPEAKQIAPTKDLPKKGSKVGKEGNAYGNAVRNTPDGEEIKINGKGTGDIKKESVSKPSAGMTSKEKSATVKKAKAGGDIGKPGKDFDKTAKAAGGGEKGKKIAAAAMWKNEAKKNVKEAIAKAKKTLDKDLEEVQSPFPSRNETDPAKKAANAAVKPGTANPAMPSRNKAPEVVKESVELVRMKTLMTRLNG